MLRVLHRLLLNLFGRLPRRVRRLLVRWGTPSYTVGALCVIQRSDDRVLLIRQRYRNRWGLPGGLMSRGELPADAARREVREEVGLDVELLGEPAVVVDPEPRRVDVVFRARVRDDARADDARPCSPEILTAAWFAPGALPELQDETVGAITSLARSDVSSLLTPRRARPDTAE